MDWLEIDTEFKYDGITTYFCIFSLLILFVIFSAAILITGFHYIEDLLVLFAGFVFFVFFYFYTGVYIIALLQERHLVRKCFKEIKYFEKSENIITISNIKTRRSFGYYMNTDLEVGTVFITRHKPVENRKYEFFELEFSNQKIYFAKEIPVLAQQKVQQKQKYKLYPFITKQS